MNAHFYLNTSMMMDMCVSLVGVEIKLLWGIIGCLKKTNNRWFINNEPNRLLLEEYGIRKTPIRLSNLLGSMAKKGVLQRISRGVYGLPEGLVKFED